MGRSTCLITRLDCLGVPKGKSAAATEATKGRVNGRIAVEPAAASLAWARRRVRKTSRIAGRTVRRILGCLTGGDASLCGGVRGATARGGPRARRSA